MFIVFLRFSSNKHLASEHMEGHKAWIKRGFADGTFLLAGSLEPSLGGCILAHQTTKPALLQRINEDPFVIHDIVIPDIHEVEPGMADERMRFLVA